jgi:thiamine-phosphate pyrophosphorylase
MKSSATRVLQRITDIGCSDIAIVYRGSFDPASAGFLFFDMKNHDLNMSKFRDAGIYLVTSESLSRGRTTAAVCRDALEGGVRLIQLREKDVSARKLMETAKEIRLMTRDYDALLIINDRLDAAMASEADGVHLGQDDLPVSEARKIAPDLIIGASTHNREEARSACRDGASYINIGPVYPTTTKEWDGRFLGPAGVREIAPFSTVPFTVMGGITSENLSELRRAGASVFAVITAVTAAENPRAAAQELLEKAKGEPGER